MRRIAFDMDGTLIGWKTRGNGHEVTTYHSLRPEAEKWIEAARKECDELVLWTFNRRHVLEALGDHHPVLTEFDSTYTIDEVPPLIADVAGEPCMIKDVEVLEVNLLIDNDPRHREWAKQHGMEDRYLVVPTYGEH